MVRWYNDTCTTVQELWTGARTSCRHSHTANHTCVSPTYLVFAFFFLKIPFPLPSAPYPSPSTQCSLLAAHSTLHLHPRQKVAGSSRSKRKGTNESPWAFWWTPMISEASWPVESLYRSLSQSLALCRSLAVWQTFTLLLALVQIPDSRFQIPNSSYDDCSCLCHTEQCVRLATKAERATGMANIQSVVEHVSWRHGPWYLPGLACSFIMPTREK